MKKIMKKEIRQMLTMTEKLLKLLKDIEKAARSLLSGEKIEKSDK